MATTNFDLTATVEDAIHIRFVHVSVGTVVMPVLPHVNVTRPPDCVAPAAHLTVQLEPELSKSPATQVSPTMSGPKSIGTGHPPGISWQHAVAVHPLGREQATPALLW